MTAPLLALMAYQVVGNVLHDWFGAGMLVLFIVHNILNYKWYASFFKGKYKPQRVFSVMVNIAVLAVMLCLGYSGISDVTKCFRFPPHRQGNGACAFYAPCWVILGLCPYEPAFGTALGNDHRDVPQAHKN